MRLTIAAMTAVLCCAAAARAQAPDPVAVADRPALGLEQAVAAAGGAAPAREAAEAALAEAQAARDVAGLRPNPEVQVQVENILGSGPFDGVRSAESTVGFAVPLELGGRRGARVAVADARLSRVALDAAIVAADIRLQVTGLYIAAVAADRRAAIAGEQARIAAEALRVATVRVEAGRASPIEAQRADVVRLNAEAEVERAGRLARTARTNLGRRIGAPVAGALDGAALDALPTPAPGPPSLSDAAGTLALAAADADLAFADAGIRLARANRVPDLIAGPAVRRLEATRDTALVFTLAMPIHVFNGGRAALAQASAERGRVEAQRRALALDVEQAIADAQTAADNAATTARTAAGPALAAAEEAARIARIGYAEGKFEQLVLLDAERALARTRLELVDALAAYQNARAHLERLTTPAPVPEPGTMR